MDKSRAFSHQHRLILSVWQHVEEMKQIDFYSGSVPVIPASGRIVERDIP